LINLTQTLYVIAFYVPIAICNMLYNINNHQLLLSIPSSVHHYLCPSCQYGAWLCASGLSWCAPSRSRVVLPLTSSSTTS
jgi:hypothetical protein